ncbi:hypothetical protein E2K98_05895 [Bacillus salipaludis]|uniref:Uncharacterized protein n=1 Tax=Bacillus salipaludis TaxID=2547811 RepID=A0A4R5VUY6_9BACI|nr:hypothetical protein [Bacillus salipaludis]MDQ6597598.1 hypothetical protein [Bacillus salipaludis]TDK62988.1 hypothetical protein E2K98_05895 [Bacillus salipaludis]
MFSFQDDALLVDDREDLIAVLRMRFGSIPGEMIEDIYGIVDMNALQRLILSAANAANWDVFLEEFNEGRDSFRLLGEKFNPLRDRLKGRDGLDGTA